MGEHVIYRKVEKLRKIHKNTHDLVVAIGRYLGDHFSSVQGKYITKDILESRFTPAEEAFDKGMTSCGSVTNVSCAMLRHVRVKVRLVHGKIPGTRNHAWVSVYEPEKKEWVQYDLSRNQKGGFAVTKDHKVKIICNDWEEIRDVLEKEHKDWLNRKLN